MQKFKHTLLGLSVLAGAASCDDFRTVVELEVPDIPDQVVMNSFYTPDSAWTVQLTGHRYILEDEPLPFLDGATVTLYSGDNELASTAEGDSGYYRLPVLPQVETDYRLEVTHPDLPTAMAETRLAAPVPLTDLTLNVPNSVIGVEGLIPGALTFPDPAGITNHYQLILYSRVRVPAGLYPNGDTLWQEYSYPVYFQLGASSAGEVIEVNPDVFWFMPGQVFSDDIFDGQSVRLPFEIYNEAAFLPEGSQWTILAEFQSLSQDYYDYAFSYGVQANSRGNPFAQPAQIFTNIEGGLGIVAGYSRVQRTFVILE